MTGVAPFNPLGGTTRTIDPTMDFGNAISRGYVYGHTRFSKNGYNMDVDDTEEDMWMVGGTYVWPTAPMQMEIVSSSALDTNTTGTGVQSVLISYLDTNYIARTERLALNGVTAVPTVATNILRVNAFRADTVGTGGRAAGNIDIRHINDTPIYSRIGAGYTRARNCAYCVPDGYELFITQITYASNAPAAGHFGRFTFRANYDEQDNVVGAVFFPFSEIVVGESTFTIQYPIPMRFPEHTCMNVSVIGDAGQANLIVASQYRGYLVAKHA
jgi:hypothetical protein